jgi:hypothetical protein
MNENELQFVLKMQDQASSVMQQFGSSTAQTGEIIKQQIAAMNQLTAALNQHASATNAADSAAKSHASSVQQGGEAARGAAGEHQGLAKSIGGVTEAAKGAAEALIGMWASNEMIKGVVEQFQETDHAIRSVMAAADLSREAVEELHKSLAAMPASQVNATVSQLDKLMVLGAKLHGTSEEIKAFAVAVGQIATGGSLESIGQGVQQILSASGEGAGGATKLADALGVLGEKTRGGVEGLTQMTGMMASMTAGMGISSEKLAQYAAAFDKIGGRPMMQVMQFNMILQQIEKQARDSGDGLKSLAERTGMTIDQMQKLAQQHPDEVYNKMLEVVSKIKEQGGDPGVFLKGFGIAAGREMQQIEALASKYKELQAIQSQDTTGGAAKYQKDNANELDLAITDLTKAWEKLKDAIGEDIFKDLATVFEAAAAAINKFSEIMKGLPQPVREAVEWTALLSTGLIGLMGAVGALRFALGGLFTPFVSGAASAVRAAGSFGGAIGGNLAAMGTGGALATGAVAAGALGLTYAAGRETGRAINQQNDLGKQGVTWGDEGHALLASFGLESQDSFTKRMQGERDAGQYRPGATVGRGETTSSEEDASEMQRQRGGDRGAAQNSMQSQMAAAKAANDNGPAQGTYGDEDIKNLLSGMDEYQKKLKEIQDQQNAFDKAVKQMSPEQQASWSAQIAQAQRMFELRKQAADPLLQENKALDDQIAKAGAVTKAAQNELAIREELRKLEEKGVEITPAVRAQVGSKMQYAQGAEQAKAYDEEVKNLQKALAASGAVTAADKQRVEIDQQIADMYEKGTIATQAQEQSVRNLLAAEKERTQYAALAASLSPVGKANQEYQESIDLLQRALGPGQALNQAMADLARNTQAARDPLGAMVTADEHELEILSQTGKYREAQVAALQEKYDLQQKGIVVDDKTLADLTEYQKKLQDLKQAQSSGIAGWIGQGPDLQKQMGELAGDFSSDLADGIENALQRKRGAFDQAGQALGKAMIKMATDDLLKSGAQALGLGDTSKQMKAAQDAAKPLSGDAQRATEQANAQAKALQDGLKNINTMTVAATNVTVNGTASAGAPGTTTTGPASPVQSIASDTAPATSALPAPGVVSGASAAAAAAAPGGVPQISPTAALAPLAAALHDRTSQQPGGMVPGSSLTPGATGGAFGLSGPIGNGAPQLGAGANNFAMLPSGLGGTSVLDAQHMTQHLMDTYGLTKEQALGPAGVMGYESGNYQTMQERGHSGTSSGWGAAQWTGPRRTGFMQNAQSQGLDPSSPEANYSMLDKELTGPYKGALDAIRQTNTPTGSADAFLSKYEGMKLDGSGPGIPAVAQHEARANLYAQQPWAQNLGPGGTPDNMGTLVAANSNKPPVDVNIHSMGGNPIANLPAANATQASGAMPGGDMSSMLTNGLMGDASHIPGAAPYLQGFGMLKNLFGSLGGAGGAASGAASAVGGAASGAAGGLGSIFSSLFSFLHTGGTVGSTPTMGLSRRLSPAVFAGAQRFHDGLGDDEFPAVLQRGERVLTANQDQRSTALMSRMADALANTSTPAGTQHADSGRQNQGGHRMTMIVNTPNASSFRSSQPQIMATQHAALQRMGAKHN